MYKNSNQPAIMESVDSIPYIKDEAMQPDVVTDTAFKSIPFDPFETQEHSPGGSLLLMDSNENLHINTPEIFCQKLGCSDNEKIKVISIFGNTGDGKSHTMNQTFFRGQEIFKTSAEQQSCTIGVHAAMQRELGVLCLDTEGQLGITPKNNRHERMLLKILAISDIVIYLTRSERLHRDMFRFLGTASQAYCEYFAQALRSMAQPGTPKTLGPAVLVFQETRNTKPLENSVEESAEDQLRKHFSQLNYNINGFSSLRYVGIRTGENHATNYSKLKAAIRSEIDNTAVRSPRQPGVVFRAMKALNLKYNSDIIEHSINPFPEQYFTCTVHCESCNRRCQRSMGHISSGEKHMNSQPCNYQHQFENKVYFCKNCYTNGKEVLVTISTQSVNESTWYGLAKYAWKGPVIECPYCGEIYRARQYWYGNKSPEMAAVRSEIVHVWKDGNITAKGPVHSAQMVVDGVTYISDTLSSLGSQPTRALTGWLADKVAPSYWRPNHEITNCHACKKNFEKTGLPKHHCRGCGEGFCHACSQHQMPVPARGWTEPVRVCNDCRQKLQRNQDSSPGPPSTNDESDILVRKYGETIYNAISSVATVAVEYPKEIIKDSARPSYWVSDADSPNCSICRIIFGTAEELQMATVKGVLNNAVDSAAANSANNNNHISNHLNNFALMNITGDCRRHHCRRCGKAVCAQCSKRRRPVPERGWQTEVRVCDVCVDLSNQEDKDEA